MKSSVAPLLLLIISSISMGCATGPRIWITPEHDRAIASEFVRWMTSDGNFPFQSETVQIRRGQGPFGNTLKANMRESGYFIQTIPDHFVAPNLISYEAIYLDGGQGRAVNYTVRVGGHEVSRKYRHRGLSGRWVAVDEFKVTRVKRLEKPREDELIAGTISTMPTGREATQKDAEPPRRLSIPEATEPMKLEAPTNIQTTARVKQRGNSFALAVQRRLMEIDRKNDLRVTAINEPVRIPVNKPVPVHVVSDKDRSAPVRSEAMLAMERRMLGSTETVDPEPIATNTDEPVKLYATRPVEPVTMHKTVIEQVVEIAASAKAPTEAVTANAMQAVEISKPVKPNRLTMSGIDLQGFGMAARKESAAVRREAMVKVGEEAQVVSQPLPGMEKMNPAQPAVIKPEMAKKKPAKINLLGF